MNGWVKLHRQFVKWEWFQKPEMVQLFLYLILSANREDGEWRGIKIKRGQLLTGRKKLSKYTGLSEQTIRTCITRLKSTNEITTKSTNKYSIITIVKYDDYQNATENQPTNAQQTHNRLTTNKKYKKLRSNTAAKAAVSKNKEKETAEDSMSLSEFVEWMRKSPQRHMQIIGEYADEKKLKHSTKGQWRSFIRRNVRAAKALSPYNDQQIAAAMKKVEKADYLTRWTLETLTKFLDE